MELFQKMSDFIHFVPFADFSSLDNKSPGSLTAPRKIIVDSLESSLPKIYSTNSRMMRFKETAMIHSAVTQIDMQRHNHAVYFS